MSNNTAESNFSGNTDKKITVSMIIKRFVIPLASVVLMVLLDQWTKYLTLLYVKGTEGFYIINKVLRIFFVKNEGMAWGMLQNKQYIFIIVTPLVIAFLMMIYYRMPFEKKYILARICVLLLTGGAIGNLLDRVFRGELFHGYVVDMIYVEIINFPVFNIADSFITVGFVMMIFSIFFVYKEKDFDMIFGKKKSKNVIEEDVVEFNVNSSENPDKKENEENDLTEEKSEESDSSDKVNTEESKPDLTAEQ